MSRPHPISTKERARRRLHARFGIKGDPHARYSTTRGQLTQFNRLFRRAYP